MRSMLGWLQQWTCLKARVVLCKFVCSNVYICVKISLLAKKKKKKKKSTLRNFATSIKIHPPTLRESGVIIV